MAQEASWVGLGWSLNAGGAISRTIKCEDDFGPDYSYKISHPYMEKGWYYDEEPLSYENITEYDRTVTILNNNKYFAHPLNDDSSLKIDTEPDIFYYSLPNLSGKFIYNKPKTPVLFDMDHNLKIKWYDPYGGFEVTDATGVKYIFTTSEETKKHHSPTGSDWDYRVTTSWLLSTIITRNGEEIRFSYEQENCSGPTFSTQKKYNLLDIWNNGKKDNSFWKKVLESCPDPIPPFVQGEPYSRIEYESLRLRKIEWKNGSIVFDASQREDFNHDGHHNIPKKLDKVSIYTKQENLVKSFLFQYEYFNNDATGKSQYLHKRLKLKNITELNSQDKILSGGHTFNYFEGTLPAKNSNNTDYWGYNNGADYGDKYYAACNSYSSVEVLKMGDNIYGSELSDLKAYSGAIKTSDFDYLKIGTLCSMTLPTGGEIKFEYEENTFRSYAFAKLIMSNDANLNNIQKGGGLRIAKIKNEGKTRIFEYDGGKLLIQPVLHYLLQGGCHYSYAIAVYFYVVQLSESTRPLSTLSKGNSVGYNKVREIVTDGDENSITEYCFYNEEEEVMYESSPFLPTIPNFMNGMVESITLLQNGNRVQTTEYTYEESPLIQVSCNYEADYPYEYNLRTVLKKSETVINHFKNDNTFGKNTQYTYNENLLPSKIVTYDSQRKPIEQQIKYSTDFQNAISQTMVQQNRISTPIEIINLKDNKVISANKVNYQNISGLILPANMNVLSIGNAVSIEDYEQYYNVEIEYNKYDSKGNIQEIIHKDGTTTTYLWSYNYEYPIAEIKNASYTQIRAILAIPERSLLGTLESSLFPADNLINHVIGAIRSNLPNSQVTTYTHRPLIGITSMTDPRGITTYYDYDNFGRLKATYIGEKDGKGNETRKLITNAYEYHYRDQQ